MKLIPSITYRPGNPATFTREGDWLRITEGPDLDCSGEWALMEWDDGEDKGLVRAAAQENGEPIITVTAYQPESRKVLRGDDLAAAEAPITLADGESVTFPDYLELD